MAGEWGTISCHVTGDYKKIRKYLEKAGKMDSFEMLLRRYGELGVIELTKATPVDTGKTASSWFYEVEVKAGKKQMSGSINWKNSNVNKGVNIALIIQYGHGTKQGAYVKGIDYINPAMKPIFDKFVEDLDGEVKAL